MKRTFPWMAVVAILLLTSPLLGQQVIPPPPKPADDGPGIAEVMKNIQDLMGTSLAHNFTVRLGPQTAPYVVETTQLALDPQTCGIRYHLKVSLDGGAVIDSDFDVLLKNVREIYVRSEEGGVDDISSSFLKRLPSNVHYGDFNFSVSPAIFDVAIGSTHLLINGADPAKRLAIELTRAVGLCAADATHLPKPSDGNPTLADTMQFIQDKLNGQGILSSQTTYLHPKNGDSVSNETDQLTDVVADPRSCQITYHEKYSSDFPDPDPLLHLHEQYETDVILTLRSIQTITVISADDHVAQVFGDERQRTAPPVFLIILKGGSILTIGDEDLANRVARALNHAVGVCTPDRKPEPF